MPEDAPGTEKLCRLRAFTVGTLVRLLSEHGLSAEEVEHGMDYAEAMGAVTARDAFVLEG